MWNSFQQKLYSIGQYAENLIIKVVQGNSLGRLTKFGI